MAPPKFDDLGKAARDLISKNFHFGVVNIEAKMKATNGYLFTTKGKHNTDTGGVGGGIETEMNVADGLKFKETWSTDNVINSTLTVDPKLLKGVKVDLETSFAPDSGKMGGKVKTAYANCGYLNATADVDVNLAGPTVQMSAVFGNIPHMDNVFVGCQASYDTANAKLGPQTIGFEWRSSDYVMCTAVYDSTRYVGSIHHQVNDKLMAGALLNWNSATADSNITFCGKYAIDDSTYMKAKLDNNLLLGLSYVQKIREGVDLTLSGLVNAKAGAGHKLGLSLNFDA